VARRAAGLRPAARSGVHDARPRRDVAGRRRRRGRVHRRGGGIVPRAPGALMAEQRMVPEARPQSYHGRPVIKPPVWKWMIPAYFFSGGLAAGSSALALGASVTGRPALRRRARVVSLLGVTASAGFLVAD